MYLLSKEGKGSAAGIVTAMAMALCDAAEELAKRSPGPFKGCEDGHSDRPRDPLPSQPPPDGMFERGLDGLPKHAAGAEPRARMKDDPPALGGQAITPRTPRTR